MRQYYTGNSGSVFYDNIKLFDVSQWSIQAQSSIYESTALGDQASTYRYGRASYSGSLVVLASEQESADVEFVTEEIFRTSSSPQPLLHDLALVMKSGRNYSTVRCQVVFENASYENTPGSVVAVSISFKVNGLLTEYGWNKSRQFNIDTKAFALTLNQISFFYDAFYLETRNFSLQLRPIDFELNRLVLDAGSFALTLPVIDLVPSFLALATLDLTLDLKNLDLDIGYDIDLDTAAYTLDLKDQDYARSWVLNLDTGVFAITGNELWPPVFRAVIYTGNASTLSVTGAGFEPSLVWTKRRTGATGDHAVYDSVRGIEKYWEPNTGDAEVTNANSLTAFNADGFTLGNAAVSNTNNAEYVSWLWTALGAASSNTDGTITTQLAVNSSAGLAAFTYTGTGANATLGHGLGVTPDLVLIKNRNSGSTACLVGGPLLGTNGSLNLTTNGATNTNTTIYRGTSSTTISVGTQQNLNANTWTYVGYAIASIAGISKVASYTGTGATDQFVSCGFNPQYVLIKATSTTGNWLHYDTARGVTKELIHTTAVESTVDKITFGSGGFTVKANQNTNTSSVTYLYLAFR